MKQTEAPPTTELSEITERLRDALKGANGDADAARVAVGTAQESLVAAIAAGGPTTAAEKESRTASAALASAELRALATGEALRRAEASLEKASTAGEIERAKATHEAAASAYHLAFERLPTLWSAFEIGFSELLRTWAIAHFSQKHAESLGATFPSQVPREALTHAHLVQLRKATTERLVATGHDPLTPPPPTILVAGFQL